MRTTILLTLLLLLPAAMGRAEDGATEQAEAEKWAAEERLDAARLGQTDTGLSVIGRIQLADRDWSAEDRQNITTIDAGVFHAAKLLRKQAWVDRPTAFQVRLANAAVLDWLRKNPSIKALQAQGRLRVDGKYFLIEDCRPADEKPMVAPPAGRSKRSGL